MAEKTCILDAFIFLTTISTVTCIVKESQNYGVAKLMYCNPKYFSHWNVESAPRVVDGVEKLYTNISFTNIVTIGNNVTLSGVLVSQKRIRYKLEHQFCNFLKQSWVQMTLKNVFHLKIPCPVSPRTTLLTNLELPFPDVPIPMAPGTYNLESELYITDSKERMFVIHYAIHYANDQKNDRNNVNKNMKG